jgi:methionyl-tRNA formyltransferase
LAESFKTAPWRIIFMGTPQIAAATLEEVLNGPDIVIGVVTQPESSAGRGQKTSVSPVRKLADSRNILLLAAEDSHPVSNLCDWRPDIIVVVYGRILPKSILGHARGLCQRALLPCRNKRAAWQPDIINGEAEGCQHHEACGKMTPGRFTCKPSSLRDRDHWLCKPS